MKLHSKTIIKLSAAWLALGLMASGCAQTSHRPGAAPPPSSVPQPASTAISTATAPVTPATKKQVTAFCGACHAMPPPDTFPKSYWRKQVEDGYRFQDELHHQLSAPPPDKESVIAYYESNAPDALPTLPNDDAPGPPPIRFQKIAYTLPLGPPEVDKPPHAAVSNICLGHLFDPKRLDVVICDVKGNRVLAISPYAKNQEWNLIGFMGKPAHAEVVDLDGDGLRDVIAVGLGTFMPEDHDKGTVIWFRHLRDGSFKPFTLLSHVGRVADAQAADLNGDGRVDLAVAVFGYRKTGGILYLENQTTDWAHPAFTPHVLDKRPGGIHVPIADIDGDGRPDIVSLISQHYESVVAFLNKGKGTFEERTAYNAPHPAYGSSGIQFVDMNGDGRLDVLYTNGDILDPGRLLRPDNGIQWLENRDHFPFPRHDVARMYGVERAVAADMGAGRQAIVACSFLPPEYFPDRRAMNLSALTLLEKDARDKYQAYPLEKGACDHFTCAAGDIYGDGRQDIVTGNFHLQAVFVRDALVEAGAHVDAEPVPDPDPAFTLWRNLGPR